MFCPECGKNIENRTVCPYCGHGALPEYAFSAYSEKPSPPDIPPRGGTSRLIAGILQIFTGAFGIGRFYMKSYKIGILQLVLSFVTFGIGGFLWGIFDGISILSGKTVLDGKGNIMDI